MQKTHIGTQTISSRYRILNQIGHGGMGVVYRAVDRLTGHMVALKKVETLFDPTASAISDMTTYSDDPRLAITKEFKVLASLRHPHIISVLDYAFDETQQPYFTMELLEDATSILHEAERSTPERKHQLILQMLQALAYLHRRGIIHRDLKPDNVMVVDGQVKVLDFGLAVAKKNIPKSEMAVGTLSYMAPELWSGQTATEASDIYSAGLIVYEILGKPLPYKTANITEMIRQVTEFVPNLESLNISPDLKMMLARMLDREPQSRYPNANQVLAVFRDITDQQSDAESSDIRESYLQAASFVGRENEFGLLMGALSQAQANKGSAWLISGESGVGKSRFMDEVQTHAMVNGALVVRGQAIAEGGLPYQMWRNVLRRLALNTDLSDLERSVLKTLIPDIGALLECEVPDAPEIEAQASSNRLLYTIESVFRRQVQPVLLLLEDLHWAFEDLLVLKRLNSMVDQLPLLILASYRDDERPDLPLELPGMLSIKLRRLSKETITELTTSMLGETGRDEAVVNLLERETEGNILFIIEAIRSLAEEAGQLDNIGRATLPAQMFAGGIQAVLRRRLARVPGDARPLLDTAAIAGRELDLKLLQAIEPKLSLDLWLMEVASVIEVQEDRYRFAHDKLRERLIQDMSAEQQANAHRQVAHGLEQVYADDPSKVPFLAYHWEKVVELGQPSLRELMKAIDYQEKAAEQFIKQNAFEKAIQTLEQLFAIEGRRQNIQVTSSSVNRYNITPERRARWYFLMAQAQTHLSHFDKGYENLKQAARLYGYPLPDKQSSLIMRILGQVGTQIRYRFAPFTVSRRISDDKRAYLTEVAETYRIAGILNYALNKQFDSLYTTLTALNIAERAGLKGNLAYSYGLMCLLTGTMRMKSVADWYYTHALAITDQGNYVAEHAEILLLTSLYYLMMGEDERGTTNLTTAAALYEQLGNMAGWAYSRIGLANKFITHGDLQSAFDILQAAVERANNTHNIPTEALGLQLLAWIQIQRNELDAAHEALLRSMQLAQEIHDPQMVLNLNAYLAQLYLYREQYSDALEKLNSAFESVFTFNPNAVYTSRVFTCMIETALSLYEIPEAKLDAESREALLKKTARVVKMLQQMPPPTGVSSAAYCQAWLLWHQGKQDKAYMGWAKAVQAAEKMDMPLEAAHAHFQWGRHLPAEDPTRKSHLEEAATLFEKHGATRLLHMVQAALRATP